MQTSFNYKQIILTGVLALLMAAPQQIMAQRFNHGGFGGGRPAAPPVSRPAPVQRQAPVMRPAPQQRPVENRPPQQSPVQSRQVEQRPIGQQPEQRPAEQRPGEQRPAEERPTINGGGRNFGNHDFSRSPEPRNPVDIRNNVTVRDRVNVYHTGGDRGFHPYYYHPYRPYYWGPHWHPMGFFLSALAADAVWFSFNNQRYWYDDGCFYMPQNGGYAVVAAPIGALVGSIPPGYETPVVDGNSYFYFGGVFYIYTGQGYQVVAAPPGAVIYQLPDGATDQQIDGQDFLVYNNTWYEPISQDGQDAYEVVPPPGQ